MPYQVDDAVRHAMSGTELSRVRTELRLLLREHINQRLLASRATDIVMQSSAFGRIPLVRSELAKQREHRPLSRRFLDRQRSLSDLLCFLL